ncbi:MAG: DUF5807 family protein [Haloferacaceae archaeon]
MDTDRTLRAFLAGARPDDVAIYLSDEALSGGDADALAEHGTRRDGGVLLVLPGERGRSAFAAGTGTDAMAFAREAMDAEGRIAPDLTGGDCPDADGGDHDVRFLLAFAEERNEEVGGRYAEGDVIHAYAQCSCGRAYSDRWVAGERDGAVGDADDE